MYKNRKLNYTLYKRCYGRHVSKQLIHKTMCNLLLSYKLNCSSVLVTNIFVFFAELNVRLGKLKPIPTEEE